MRSGLLRVRSVRDQMNAENWEQIKDLLERALGIEPARRRAFLSDSGAQPAILAEVESLLDVDGRSSDFMSLDLVDFSKDLVSDAADEESPIGQKIGIYEVVRELGIGGMGAVYLAERTDGKFEQKVAVKMLKREFNIGKIRRKFEREREILSKLNHPNISRLLDSGTTADGIPYIVMEYVEGVPIDQHCRTESLSLIERLKLFNKVCNAVSFAHQNLIIHRDLKPSNIIVAADGEPKLLDFGISKLLDSVDSTELTLFASMTPQYASPEQARGESVSTATDVYSLGVVLYKILTGALPIDVEGKTNGDIINSIAEDLPIPASVAAKTAPNGVDDRRNGPSIPAGQLEGDLDNIILKALSKEPERRYVTVEQFSTDIWRHIDGLPILARPATRRYRALKFYRRHRIPVVAAVLVLLSLFGGLGLALFQAREARAQTEVARLAQQQSESETEKAKEEQRKSEKVTKFVSRIFGYANPGWFAEGAKTQGKARVIDVVEDLSTKIDEEFANEPDVAAELHATFSSIFHWVSRSAPPDIREEYQKKRRSHALRGIELRKRYYGEFHERVAVDMYATYGMIGTSEEEKAAYLMKGINMLKATNPRNNHLAYMYESFTANLIMPESESRHAAFLGAVDPPTGENKYLVAERMLREALDIWKLHYPADHGVILSKNCWLAYSLAKQEKWAEFDEPFQICRQIELRSTTDDGLKTLMPEVERVRDLLKVSGKMID